MIKELDQRSHEKCRDNGAYSNDGGYFAHGTAAPEKDGNACDDADQVGGDTTVLELGDLIAVSKNNGYRIIGRDAKVGSHVQGRADANDQDAQQKTAYPNQHRRIGDQSLQKVICKFGNVS